MTWPTKKISEVCEVIPGFAFKSEYLGEDGIPVIKIGNITDNHIVDIDSVQRFPDNLVSEKHKKFYLRNGDMLIAMTGATAGKVGRIHCAEDLLLLLNQRVAKFNPKAIDPDFFWFTISTNRYRTVFYGLGGGAAQPNMSSSQIESVEISCPPLSTQQCVASILTAYDDLIKNNRRRIQLLEQVARLLFKEWFVHLRFPGHEHVKIIDSVPEGWGQMTVADACTEFLDGDWIESKDQGGEDFRLLQISNIGDNEFVETGNFRYITSETYRNLRCNEVITGDILISRMPKPIGRAWFVYPQPWRMITAVDVTIARPNPEVVNPFYFLYYLNSPSHIARCEQRATGATRPRISRKIMGGLPILTPPMSIQLSFGEVASAINAQRYSLTCQIEKLTKARDILLPRLMSGVVAV